MCSKETYETSVCKHICVNRRQEPRRYTAVSPPVSTMTPLAQISLYLNCTVMSSHLLEKKGAKLLTSANLQFSWLCCSARFCLDNWLQLLIQQRACSVVRVQLHAPKYSWIWKANKLYSFLLSACPCVFVESGFLLYNQSPAGFCNWASR